jgi:hypothetical protein
VSPFGGSPGDQLITPSGFWAVVSVHCKIAYGSVEAVKLFKNKLKYAVFWHSEALLND